jgi:acyl-CoA thioesterase-1
MVDDGGVMTKPQDNPPRARVRARTHALSSDAALALCAALCVGLAACGGDAGEAEGGELGDGYADVALPPVAAPNIPSDAPLVLFLGDSLAAGLHLPADYAFPAAAQRRLAAQGVPFRLANLGSSGDTSAGGLARIDWALRAAPDVVVIELGANDGLRGIALSSTEQNLRAIVAAVRAAGARPVLLGMQVPPNLGAYADELAALYPRIAAELDVPLVASFLAGVGGVPELNLADQLHPNPAGHERLAATLAPTLRATLEAMR